MPWIVFEGSEGVGKTTQIEMLSRKFDRLKIHHLLTREPGGTPFGEQVRGLFKTSGNLSPLTELYLLSASRNDHLTKKIKPALQEGKFVICDRFLDSTFVYQMSLKGLSKEIIDQVSSSMFEDLVPDLTIILSSKTFRTSERKVKDHHDLLGYDDLLKLNHYYEELAHQNTPYPNGKVPKRRIIEAKGDREDVGKEIWNLVKQEFGLKDE